MSVRITDLPLLEVIDEEDAIELIAAYLECCPEGATEDEIARWVSFA